MAVEMDTTIPIDFEFSKLLSDIVVEKKKKRNQLIIKDGLKEKVYNDLTDALLDTNCSECNSLNIKEIDGYYVCLDCGLKNDNVIDCGQEWRFYANDYGKCNDQARCDLPTNELIPKASMGSFIGYGGKETATTKRIRNMTNWYAMPYKETVLLETFNNITIMAQNSGLNQCIVEEAKYMYKRVSEVKASRRSKKEGMKAGSISLACKLKGVPRNCTEIAKICHIKNSKTLRKSIKTFEEIWNNIEMVEKGCNNNMGIPGIGMMNLRDDIDDTKSDIDDTKSDIDDTKSDIDDTKSDIDDTKSDIDDITDNDIGNSDDDTCNSDITDEENKNIDEYITKLHRYASQLGIEDKIFQYCKAVLIHIETASYLDKHNPLSRISAIIYYANERYKLNINKHTIMKVCEVSEVTVNKCYQKLTKYSRELNSF
jgi:transcription initiation factor TFIIIB Brf1 subunit/transcription initiation factor TFIIB